MTTTGIQRFFVDALGGALDQGLAVPEDVIKHVTPDVLAAHLPRSLWAKLLAACLAAARVDARLIVDTIGLVDLSANIPGTVLWNIVADVAVRALGKGLVSAPPPPVPVSDDKAKPAEEKAKAHVVDERPRSVTGSWSGAGSPPGSEAADKAADKPAEKAAAPEKPAEKFPENKTPVPPVARFPVTRPATNPGVSAVPISPVPVQTASPRATTVTTTTTSAAPVPLAPSGLPQAQVVDIDFEDDDEPEPLDAPPVSPHRAPTVAGPSASTTPSRSTGNGARGSGAGASSRRPQASASPRTSPRTTPPSSRRGATPASSDFDLDTDVGTPAAKPAAEEVPVDDDQLIDWSASEETQTSGGDGERKR